MSLNFYEIAAEWTNAVEDKIPNIRNKNHMAVLEEILKSHIDDTELIESMVKNLKESHLNKSWDIRRQFSDDE
jgi:hypothetical protein